MTVYLTKKKRKSDICIPDKSSQAAGRNDDLELKDFENMVKDVNIVLLYLSNVEVSRCE